MYRTNHGMLADLEVQKKTQNIADRIPVINIVKIEESREIGTARERKFAPSTCTSKACVVFPQVKHV